MGKTTTKPGHACPELPKRPGWIGLVGLVLAVYVIDPSGRLASVAITALLGHG